MNIKTSEYSSSFEDKRNHVKVYGDLNQDINYGDCFKINDVRSIENRFNNSSSFDYRRYMFSKKIMYMANIESYEYTNNNLVSSIKQLRMFIIKRNCQKNAATCPFINQLIFGEKAIANNDQELYGEVGLAPVFAISGLHITLFFNAILYVLAKFRIVHEDSKKVGFIVLSIYSILAGSSVSVKRAILMLGLQIFGKCSSLNSLLVSLIILLLINPLIILNSGFELSYLITAVILTVPLNKFENKLYNSILLSYVCYFAALPISYHFNYSFNLLAPICILLVTPIIISTLIPCCIIATVFDVSLLYALISIQIHLINIIAHVFEQFTIVGGHVNWLMWIIYIILIVALIIYWKANFIKYAIIWFIAISLDITVIAQVSFIDVGQGDCALVETMFKNYLFDVGNAPDEVVNELKYLDAINIDGLFISHAHLDHYGSMSELSKELHIANVYELEGNQVIRGSTSISEYQSNRNIVLFPYYGTNDNDRELVVKVMLGNYSILFPGDVELESEEYLVDNYCNQIQSTVIKVPHHGSRTSSSDEFLDCVKPEIAVISSGKRNMYHHPSDEIVEKYENRALLYNTQDVGEIKLWFKRSGIEIWTKEKLR